MDVKHLHNKPKTLFCLWNMFAFRLESISVRHIVNIVGFSFKHITVLTTNDNRLFICSDVDQFTGFLFRNSVTCFKTVRIVEKKRKYDLQLSGAHFIGCYRLYIYILFLYPLTRICIHQHRYYHYRISGFARLLSHQLARQAPSKQQQRKQLIIAWFCLFC